MNVMLSLRMQTRVAPQLVMSGQLLRAPMHELEQLVEEALRENPALERRQEASPATTDLSHSFTLSTFNSEFGDGDDRLNYLAVKQTVEEYLQDQLRLIVDPEDFEAAVALVYELDRFGYLRQPREELAERMGIDRNRLEGLIASLHQLEPPGIGAKDLRECMLIQCRFLLEQKKSTLASDEADCHLAFRLLVGAWDEFTRQQFSRAARKLNVEPRQVERAVAFITRSLYPYPLNLARECSDAYTTLARPDLIIHRRDSSPGVPHFWVEIPGETAWELRLSSGYPEALRAKQAETDVLSTKESEWVYDQVQRARSFIAAMEQRWGTLRRIAEFVVAFQSEFFATGPSSLHPLTRAAVAEALDMHESTVSRAVSDKVLQLPGGRLIPLSDLFDHSLPVKEAIRDMLTKTGGSLSDLEIAERLRVEGIEVARRTVAKYRNQLKIPNSRERITVRE